MISKKLEHTLYTRAETKADYFDVTTLRSRLQKIAMDIVNHRSNVSNKHKATRRFARENVMHSGEQQQQRGSLVGHTASHIVENIESTPPNPTLMHHPTLTRVVTPTAPMPKDAVASPLDGKPSVVQQSITPPPQLVCPITLEMMADPVVAMDGHSYERAAILQFFQSCEARRQPLRSPMTRELLPGRLLIDNVVIRSQCREYQEKEQHPTSI